MADDKKTLEVDGFPLDTEVSIKIDGNTYQRLAQLLLELAMDMDIKELPKFIAEISEREPKNTYEYHLATLCFLIGDIEAVLKTEGHVIKIEIPNTHPDESNQTPDSAESPETVPDPDPEVPPSDSEETLDGN